MTPDTADPTDDRSAFYFNPYVDAKGERWKPNPDAKPWDSADAFIDPTTEDRQ